MARIRSIKPEFWTDEEFCSDHTRDERLLYAALLNYVFDNWCGYYRPRSIKRECMPFDDDITTEDVAAMMQHLADHGRLVFFEHDGRECFYLPKAKKHQRVDRPTASPIPEPDDSSNARRTLVERSPLDRIGKEGIGGEGTRAHAREDAPPGCFEEAYEAYPLHRFRDDALAAYSSQIAGTGVEADFLAACRKAPRDTRQSLGRFITDRTWRDFVPRRGKKRCDNPECINGFVVTADDCAAPCPSCGVVA